MTPVEQKIGVGSCSVTGQAEGDCPWASQAIRIASTASISIRDGPNTLASNDTSARIQKPTWTTGADHWTADQLTGGAICGTGIAGVSSGVGDGDVGGTGGEALQLVEVEGAEAGGAG